jgi:membrane protease YdiL (CAAX protease family)
MDPTAIQSPVRSDVDDSSRFELSTEKPARPRRWIDLGLVLLVAFAPAVAGSVYSLLYPAPYNYTNGRLAAGLLQELTALAVFAVLFSRQGRRTRDLGLHFHWTALPKGLYLVIGSLVTLALTSYGIRSAWLLVTHRVLQARPAGPIFATSSFWLLIPFLILNPFFEEVLVRGYLMTEIIELRSSVLLASLVSIALQTSYHLYYGVFGALIVASGLAVFALYYAKTRDLMSVIVAHLLWDLTALLRMSPS